MRDLTPEEREIWNRLAKTVTPFGEPRKAGFDTPLQLIRPAPSWTLDLHGYTVKEAFDCVKEFVEDAYWAEVRYVTIITGRSGLIFREFAEWINRYPVQRHELLSSGGAYRVFICKKPLKTAK